MVQIPQDGENEQNVAFMFRTAGALVVIGHWYLRRRQRPFLGNEKSKNWSEGAKSNVSPRAKNGPLTKARIL